MSSLRQRNGKLNIRYYDENGKRREHPTPFPDTKEGLKAFLEFQKAFDKELKAKKDKWGQPHILPVDISIQDAFQHFLKNNSDRDKTTIYEYKNFYNKLISFFPSKKSCNIITKLSAEEFIYEMKKSGISHNSQYVVCKNLKHFLNFLFEYDYTPAFVLNKKILIRQKIKEIVLFEDNDINKILKGLKKKNTNFQCLVYLLLFTGLRPSDLLTIEKEKIDLKELSMQYYSPKLKEFRTVPIHPELLPILRKRLKKIEAGKILNYSNSVNAGRALSRYFKSIKIKKKGYTARTSRKTFINTGYKEGVKIENMSELVGHSIVTEQKYYRKFSLMENRQDLEKISYKKKSNLKLINLKKSG